MDTCIEMALCFSSNSHTVHWKKYVKTYKKLDFKEILKLKAQNVKVVKLND